MWLFGNQLAFGSKGENQNIDPYSVHTSKFHSKGLKASKGTGITQNGREKVPPQYTDYIPRNHMEKCSTITNSEN